jgi:hypothetical protein
MELFSKVLVFFLYWFARLCSKIEAYWQSLKVPNTQVHEIPLSCFRVVTLRNRRMKKNWREAILHIFATLRYESQKNSRVAESNKQDFLCFAIVSVAHLSRKILNLIKISL